MSSGPSFCTFRAVLADCRAVSTVELALVTPFLAMLLMGITDLAQATAQKLKLQSAAHRALELAAVGGTTSSAIQTQAATAAGVPTSQVTVTYTLECDGTQAASYSGSCTAGQEAARYIRVRVDGSFAPRFDYGPLNRVFAGRSANGTVGMAGEAVLRIQ